MMRAAFLDRDGVINVDTGYLSRVEDFAFVPGAVGALRRLHDLGFRLIVVTNQSGLARGLFDDATYAALTAHMTARLAADGVTLTGVYHCPHLPDAAVAAYRRVCDCRKPAPGLIRRAAADHAIDLTRSVLVGDKPSDIAAGRAAGVGRCFLVGGGRAEAMDADAGFPDLAACVAGLDHSAIAARPAAA